MVLGAIVEGCAVGAERSGDEDAAIGIRRSCLTSEGDGTEQGGIGARGIEADFGVAHARDLIAGGLDDVGASFDVGAMDSDDLLRGLFEDVCGPERTVDIGAEVFEFGGHAAVEDVDAAQNVAAHA